jgi:16S rRNA (uracil1498-N3)-methyltransferase
LIRLFVPADLGPGADVVLGREATHYIANVMRQGVGASLALFNGRDGEWKALITEAGKRAVRLSATEQLRPQETPPDLELVVAAVKRGRLETIVEKATELGARRVRLVITQHTNAERVRIERLQIIAIEAAEQTGRLDVPQIEEPARFGKLLEAWDPARRLMFCDEAGDARPVIEAVKAAGAWAILIGPEGGFSAAERERLRLLPYVTPVTLGPRILRADTAAISALTLWQAAIGDWRA